MEHRVKTDTHMAWKSAALQRQAGDNNQLPMLLRRLSQASLLSSRITGNSSEVGHCAVLTSSVGDSNQYSP